jgi:hypothetical protein
VYDAEGSKTVSLEHRSVLTFEGSAASDLKIYVSGRNNICHAKLI